MEDKFIKSYTEGNLTPSKLAQATGTTEEQAKEFILSTKTGIAFQPNKSTGHYVVKYPHQQYQIDLMFNMSGPAFLIAVDTFTRRLAAVPINNKDQSTLANAMRQINKLMGGPAETIYSDQESGFRNSPEWLKMLASEVNTQRRDPLETDTKHIYSRSGHASFIESAIGTAKHDIARIRSAKEEAGLKVGTNAQSLQDYIDHHNKFAKHYITHMTPEEAENDMLTARAREEAYRLIHYKQTTPVEMKVGDKVVVAKKLGSTEKRSTAVRFDDTPKVIDKVEWVPDVGNLYTIGKTEYTQRDLQPVGEIRESIKGPPKPIEQTNSNKIALSQVAVPGANLKPKNEKRRSANTAS